MSRLGIPQRFVPNKDRRPPRAAYALPTFFTAGNLFLGFISIAQSFQAVADITTGGNSWPEMFANAAKAIGLDILLDGLDGRIDRMTNTVSDFGRELDSLADVITFGTAPAVLAFAWGVHPAVSGTGVAHADQIRAIGVF